MPEAFRPLPPGLRPRSVLARGGHLRSQFMETCEAVYMSSGYVYKSAEEAESAFANDGSRYVYSRYANPTVSMFEERLRLFEGAEACRAPTDRDGLVQPDVGQVVLGHAEEVAGLVQQGDANLLAQVLGIDGHAFQVLAEEKDLG